MTTTQYPLRLPADKPLITVTHPEPSIWILELHNGPDSRITQTLIQDGIMPALDAVERDWRAARRGKDILNEKDLSVGAGSLIIVGNRSQDKFFSNGLDYVNTSKDESFFPYTFHPLFRRLLFFPIPTVAAINGHCFAAGFVLSVLCDYRVMTTGKHRNAWMSMNEVHFGAPWPLSFATILRAKLGDGRAHREVALEGKRITPQRALEMGLVDVVYGETTVEVLGKAVEVAKQAGVGARTGVWGLIKMDLYRDAYENSLKDYRVIMPAVDDARAKSRL